MAITSGLYELRSMLLTSMAFDIAGGNTVRGANVQLYSSNDTNAQKFYLVEESASHWSIQNAQSRLYMDVAGGAAANGTNIQQYSDNDTRAQRWNIQDTGNTVTIDGVACQIVVLGSYVAGDGTSWVADVDHAMTTSKTNIQLHSPNGTPAQQFALYPTTLQDAGMPVPSGRGWATMLGSANSQTVLPAVTTGYPCWYFTDAWNGLSEHGFEISYRSRTIASGTAQYGEWSDYTAWAAASITLYGQTAWLTSGLPATFDETLYKGIEYNLRVRSTSVVNSTQYHSKAVTMTLRAVFAPAVQCTSAVLRYNCLRLTFSTDYEGGTNFVRVTSFTKSTTGTEILAKPIVGSGYGPEFTLDIPISNFKSVPDLAAHIISYEVGSDQYAESGVTNQSAVTVTKAPNATMSLSVNATYQEDGMRYMLQVTAGSGAVHAYAMANGEIVPAVEVSSRVFCIYPAFGVETQYLVMGRGLTNEWRYITGTLTGGGKPCHAWNWGDDGFFALDVVDGFMQTSRSLKASYSDFELNGREWHSLKFSDTLGGEFTAEGVLKDGLTDSTKAQLLELLRAHNVTYRAPSGEMARVGITDVQYQTIRNRTSVSISMVQVSV